MTTDYSESPLRGPPPFLKFYSLTVTDERLQNLNWVCFDFLPIFKNELSAKI